MTGAAVMGWLTLSGTLLCLDLITAAASGGVAGWSVFLALASIPFWIVGALIIATPVWAFLHGRGATTRRDAIIGGAVCVGLTTPVPWMMLAPAAAFDPAGAAALFAMTLAGAISGGVAGRTLHGLFYEPERGHARPA